MSGRKRPTGCQADWSAVKLLGGRHAGSILPAPPQGSVAPEALADPITSPALGGAGFAQLARYLGRAWARAGIAPHRHEDCTQAVYLALIEDWGSDRFRYLVREIGRRGIHAALAHETDDGLDFLRAIDRVKQRARRARSEGPLDATAAVVSPRRDALKSDRLDALREAIRGVLSPREADLIDATLAGERPAAIGARWGVTAKTVSNEKSRIIHKLRAVLFDRTN